MTAPLAGIKVLELARVLAGPVCGQLLADLGADVVKVERPGIGDETRQWGPPFLPPDDAAGETRGPSAYFLSCNRGKRSLELDFTTAAGQTMLRELISRADVLIENFLPDALAKFGLTPTELHAINPQLVVVSISGYGRTGPLASKPGYDLVTQADSGVMSITGEANGAPMKIGVAMADVVTGLYAAVSALAGLLARGKMGPASFDLALSDCTLASLVNVAQGSLVTGARPKRYGNAHPHIVPYEAFATADGNIVLAIGNDGQFARFCRAISREAWITDSRFATNSARVQYRSELIPLIGELMRQRTTIAWDELLTHHDVPHGPVLAIDEVLRSPQIAARGMVKEMTDAHGRNFAVLASPIHWPGRDEVSTLPPPDLGQHNGEVLRDWLGK